MFKDPELIPRALHWVDRDGRGLPAVQAAPGRRVGIRQSGNMCVLLRSLDPADLTTDSGASKAGCPDAPGGRLGYFERVAENDIRRLCALLDRPDIGTIAGRSHEGAEILVR